ncbi:ArsR/SmtB family transcription factor [Brachybacterium sp. GCM10030252]|uniref:ArsR/SmtB family transcription factor n=1 Tax=Brachybacterium sp. GCM10030252 TaxID=3273380 RepID=UPI0036226325
MSSPAPAGPLPDCPTHTRTGESAATDDALVGELRDMLASVGSMEEIASRMALLSDPRRLQILFCIHAHPGVRSTDIARAIEARESTTSHALALLREAGWVSAERAGREIRYEISDGLAHELLHRLGSAHLPGVHHPE